MQKNPSIITPALLCLSVALAAPATADDEQAPLGIGDDVPLQASDLRQISAQVLAANPELASSPGIKFADAYRSVRSTDLVDVVFHPHTDTGGVKQAFQVGCSRSGSAQPWVCDAAELRRYLRVENQEFEVRVTGALGSEEALAVVEATRASLPLYLGSGTADVCQAILLMPVKIGYTLRWACEGRERPLFMHAIPVAGADARQASSWQISEYEPYDSRLTAAPTAD